MKSGTRIAAVAIAATLAMVGTASACPSEGEFEKRYVTAKSGLNVRAGDGTEYAVKTVLLYGAEVDLVDTIGNWAAIDFDGALGSNYVSLAWLSDTKPTEAVTPAQSYGGDRYYTTCAVILRSKPSTSGDRLDCAQAHETVRVTGETGDWYKVDYNGKAGYMAKRLLKAGEYEAPKEPNNYDQDNPTASNGVNVKTGWYTVTASKLNVRTMPDADAPMIDDVRLGKSVQVIDCAGDWAKILYEHDGDSRRGWVAARWLKEE